MKAINKTSPDSPFPGLKMLTTLCLFLSACNNFVKIDPPVDQLNSSLVFADEKTAQSTIDGMYSFLMQTEASGFNAGFTLFAGMSADELYYFTSGVYDSFVENKLLPTEETVTGTRFWVPLYKSIYNANAIIDAVATSDALSPASKDTLSAEAKFVRALCYYYLVNFFGKVPLVTSSNYLTSLAAPRADVADVNSFIIEDLLAAKRTLPVSYKSQDRIRPNKFAASALLARMYLATSNWEAAEQEATEVLSAGIYQISGIPLEGVFLKNSQETIWQLKPVIPNRNTSEGYQIIPATTASTPTFLASQELVDAFEPGDLRKSHWLQQRFFRGDTLYYPAKYKVRGEDGLPPSEYNIILRLAEQYLIRAEAAAMLNKLEASRDDINVIRSRAGLDTLQELSSQSQILLAIEKERRIEFMNETGHRWLDLKRTGRIGDVLGQSKPNWNKTASLWPIPQSEILSNPSLLPQNAGY